MTSKTKATLLLAIALILPSCTRKPVHVPPGHTAQDQCHICTGGFAHAYHDDPDCRGLRQCNRSVSTVTIQEAADDGYRPCAYCYKIH